MSENNQLSVPDPSSSPENQEGISSSLFKEFLDNQSKELELKSNELNLKKQEDEHSFQFAQQALSAQIEDRKEQRGFHLKTRKLVYIFATIVSVLFIAFLVFTLAMGKDQITMELIKAVIFIATGSVGGYAIGKLRRPSEEDSSVAKNNT